MPETPPKTDRRAQRSRELILEALFALMTERGYERLTIQNLIDRAGVGRATFYAHFQSKEELLAASIGRLRDWLEQAGRARGDEPLGFTQPFFQHLASHRRIYEMMTQALGVDPRRCVYLDDLGVNLKPAREMGMTTIKVVSAAQALAELEAATGLLLR